MMYTDYRDAYRACEKEVFFARFAQTPMHAAYAQCFAVGAAQKTKILTMDTLFDMQQLCLLQDAAPADLLCGMLQAQFKKGDALGCKAEDAHVLTADFVQEVNAFGQNNPLFYAAYLIGVFCRIAPFEGDNLSCALVLCNFYLVSKNMPPLLFLEDVWQELSRAVQIYCREESVSGIRALLQAFVQLSAERLLSS